MSNEIYAFALKNTLKEIKNACPDVTNTFIFEENTNIIAKDEKTTDKTIRKAIESFNNITERADTIGGVIETVTIQSKDGKVTITNMNNFYLTTVASKEADEKYVNTLTKVVIPIVIKLVDEIQPEQAPAPAEPEPEPEEETIEEETAQAEDEQEAAYEPEEPEEQELEKEAAPEEIEEPEEFEPEETEQAEPEPMEEEQQLQEPEEENGLLIPDPPVTQLIVEDLGGLLVPSDTVRVDEAVISQWNDLYGDRKLEEVDIEALNGKTTRCKFRNIKDSKYQGKGIIQMPDKIQKTLETSKAELVMIKPVVE
jgi:predicted regulator of Ras-like GTPase activity (Roadblock/LC7/MglB family)